ncbi:MAG TPA: Lar family restriction alleviation protein [Steroidobacteraceae bacterium]|jgi:Lar family restriction alleviation protein
MGPDDTHQFIDMDGQPLSDAPEPLSCPFCGSGAAQLVVERWSDADDPDPAFHVECLKCGSNGPQGATQIEAAAAWNERRAS